MSEFEQLLESLDSFGPYQRRIFVLVSAFETPAAWSMLLPLFAHAKPTWQCPATEEVNMSSSAVPFTTTDTIQEDECSADGYLCYGGNYTSEFTSIVTEWDLVCDRSYVGSLITTIQMVGVLVGALITGQLADTYGRRKTLYIVYALLMILGLASSFATSWQLYAGFRFFIGAFFGGTLVVNFVLPLEYVGAKWRTFCGCIGFWAVGVMLQALLGYFIRDWRQLSIVCNVAGLPVLLTWWWVPESARWLALQGRLIEAENIFKEMANFNNRTLPDLSSLEIFSKTENKRMENAKKYTYLDLFRNIPMTKNALIMMYAWFVSSSVYYGTSLNVGNLAGNRYLNIFISGLVEIPALVFVVLVNNRLGRKITLALLMLVAGLSCFGILFLDIAGKPESLPTLTTVLAMIGRSGIAGGWSAAQVFSAEVFPTVVRNIGVGASSMSARIGGIIAPQIVFLNELSKPLPFLVFGGLATVCGVLALILPETLNQPLPDTLPPRTLFLCLKNSKKPNSHENEDTSQVEIDLTAKHLLTTYSANKTTSDVHDSVDPCAV